MTIRLDSGAKQFYLDNGTPDEVAQLDSKLKRVEVGVERWWQPGAGPPSIEVVSSMRGLGDLVAKVANPIAKALGINTQGCGCKQRQEALNRLVPFGEDVK